MQTIPDRGGEDAAGVVTAGGVPAAMITASRKGRARVPARFQSYRVGVKNDDPFVIAGETGCAGQEKGGGNPPVPRRAQAAPAWNVTVMV